MWPRELGDWQERRHRRPPCDQTLPPSNVNTGSSRFMYRLPSDVPGSVPLDAPKVYAPVETRAAEDHHLTSQWVTVSGADHRDIGNIREFLDLRVGRTIAHYTISAPLGGDAGAAVHADYAWDHVNADAALRHASNTSAFYVQFEDAASAAQAVRIAHFVVEAAWGVAAAAGERHRARVRGLRPIARASTWEDGVPGRRTRPSWGGQDEDVDNDLDNDGDRNSFEFVVSTCVDRAFLASRAAAMRQKLWGRDAARQRSSSDGADQDASAQTAAGGVSPSPATAARVTVPRRAQHSVEAASPGRRSDTLEPPHELSYTPPPPPQVESEDLADGAHPLLPRHGGGPMPSTLSSTGSSYTIDVDASPGTSTVPPARRGAGRSVPTADRFAVMREAPETAHGRGGDSSFIQEEGHFTGRSLAAAATQPQEGNRSVLSLFFTSWLSTYDNVWVTLARGAVVLIWTTLRFLGALFQLKALKEMWARHGAPPAGDDAAALAAMEALATARRGSRRSRTSRHRGRGAANAYDVAAWLGTSPIALISRLFRRCCVVAPTSEEVDMTLWSWLSMRSPFPQQSLRSLKRYLFLHRPYYSPGQADVFRGTPFTHYDRFRALPRGQSEADAVEEAYYRNKGLVPPTQPLPGVEEPVVLVTWRPAPVLVRYSLLSAVLCLFVVLKLYDLWAQAE